ncbi:MAG: hypothetical protein VYB80_05400 [Actinomycetota bacterium]|nr:hypothetical protein [Actinomycetota bacterium]
MTFHISGAYVVFLMSTDSYNSDFLTVMARMGARPDPDFSNKGILNTSEGLRSHGYVRVAPLMLLADMVVGMQLESLVDDWTFTTDFSFRRGFACTGNTINAHSRILRHGKKMFIEEVNFVAQDGVSVGCSYITFLRTPLREGESKPDIRGIRKRMAENEIPPLVEPIEDVAGVLVDDASTGRVVLHPDDSVRRPGGFVQGAIMTLVGEIAAQSFAEYHYGEPCTVLSLDARYLIGGRSGPLTTTAEWVGEPRQGVIKVSLLDEGHDVLSCSFLIQALPCSQVS